MGRVSGFDAPTEICGLTNQLGVSCESVSIIRRTGKVTSSEAATPEYNGATAWLQQFNSPAAQIIFKSYYPGATNVRLADVVVISKMDTAPPEAATAVELTVRRLNPGARVVFADCPVRADNPAVLAGRRVLAIDDGPTLTHGGMAFGAAVLAARAAGARQVVNPRPFAVGEIAEVLGAYPHVEYALPALGYGEKQVRDLEATIAAAVRGGFEAIAIGTPIDLSRLVKIPVPATRVRYEIAVRGGVTMEGLLAPVLPLMRSGGRAG